MSSSCSESEDDDNVEQIKGEILKSDIGNYYAILKIIGSGAYSTVWLGHNINENKYYAVKILKKDEEKSGLIEINTFDLLKNKSEHICNIKEHFMCNINKSEHLIIIFELLGCSLFDLMGCTQYSHGLPINIVKKVLFQLLTVIDAMHDNNIIHTDIKPENILIEGLTTKMTSFIEKFKKFNIKKMYDAKVSKNFHKWNNIKMSVLKTVVSNVLLEMKYDTNDDINDVTKEADKTDIDNSETDDDRISIKTDTSSDDSNSCFNYKNDDEECIIDIKYIQNIKIKLGDFGTVLHNSHSYNVQTRYYRAPEIILKHSCTTKIDIWSIGCLLYELLTGKLLFHPTKTKTDNRNRHHIYNFVSILGPIPDKIINESINKYLYFKHNNILKGNTSIKYISLSTLINTQLSSYTEYDRHCIVNFLYRCLEYVPDERDTALSLLNNDIFNE